MVEKADYALNPKRKDDRKEKEVEEWTIDRTLWKTVVTAKCALLKET
jgi:hypothetical protein